MGYASEARKKLASSSLGIPSELSTIELKYEKIEGCEQSTTSDQSCLNLD